MVKNLPIKKFRARWFYTHVIPDFQATGHPILYKFFQAMEQEEVFSSAFWEVNITLINPDKDITKKEIISLCHSQIQL